MTLKFKTDENLSPKVALHLRSLGHDAMTVYEQKLTSSPDEILLDVCRKESRILITLDRDFCEIRNYPPHLYSGIVVLTPYVVNRASTLRLVNRILPMLEVTPIEGHLWIVDNVKVRIRS